MSLGFSIAIAAAPFLDLLDREEEALATQVLEAGGEPEVAAAMDRSRRRLAQGVDAFVRSLPTLIRNDANTARAAAYTLVGLVDERMLHHPAGGLDRWRDRLLEFELYGSALAGQEIVLRARASAYGSAAGLQEPGAASESLLAPLYLGVLRAGFEGSLRGDLLGLTSLVTSLEETVGTDRGATAQISMDARPKRFGVSPLALATLGLAAWLLSGFAIWLTLPRDSLDEAAHIAQRITSGLPVLSGRVDPLERSVGPSGLTSSRQSRVEPIRLEPGR